MKGGVGIEWPHLSAEQIIVCSHCEEEAHRAASLEHILTTIFRYTGVSCVLYIRVLPPIIRYSGSLPSPSITPAPCHPYFRYAGITGVPEFLAKALAFAYGDDCVPLAQGRIAATQTLSGTGACRIAAEFWARFLPEGTAAYVSDPTWPNHIPIFETAGMEVRSGRRLAFETIASHVCA